MSGLFLSYNSSKGIMVYLAHTPFKKPGGRIPSQIQHQDLTNSLRQNEGTSSKRNA